MVQKPQHVLVFRLSSLGDVAMTAPILKLLLQQYPQLQITMVSTSFVAPIFQDIERLNFFAADIKGKHKGITGLYLLYREIKQRFAVDAIADLHDSVRSKILRLYFSVTGLPVSVIDKGRREKKELTREINKILRPVTSTFQRYADVFLRLGLSIELNKIGGLLQKPSPGLLIIAPKQNGAKIIGIAPFARYNEKTYPPALMKEVLRLLCASSKIMIYLFGEKKDREQLTEWDQAFSSVQCLAGEGDLASELAVIANLDVMVSMDSANMHLASMYGVPVVSIWGGTHPYLGFYGWGQNLDNAVQIDLPCRPSSVFGNKECKNNMACMHGISPIVIYEKIISLLK